MGEIERHKAATARSDDCLSSYSDAVPFFSKYAKIIIIIAAGVASVLVSMPLDVIKTYLQTHGAEIAVSPGVQGQVAAFWQTGESVCGWLLLCVASSLFVCFSLLFSCQHCVNTHQQHTQ